MRVNAKAGSQIINTDIIATIKWLNLEIKKSFNFDLNAVDPITCTIEKTDSVETGELDISDSRKLRIVTRVGTAATVIAAGTMFATMGIGGIVVAASMLAGIGAASNRLMTVEVGQCVSI